MGFLSTTSATLIRRYAQATFKHQTPTRMKLTVAALALLVAGASYADMAAAWDAPLKEALMKSGDVQGFGNCNQNGDKEVCMVTFDNHQNVKAIYKGQRHHQDDTDVTEQLKVKGKESYTDKFGDGYDKYGGHVKARSKNGQVKFSGKIKDAYYTPGVPGQQASGKGKMYYTCSANGCGWNK